MGSEETSNSHLKTGQFQNRTHIAEILTANQIQFVNLVIDYLTQAGWMGVSQLYESPFTDFSPKGVEGIFNPEQVTQLIGVLDKIRARAIV